MWGWQKMMLLTYGVPLKIAGHGDDADGVARCFMQSFLDVGHG